MEDQILSFGLSTASRSYQSRLKSHFELFMDFEEVDGDDELKTAYPCPFCAEDFDLLELCCHIDLEHPLEAKSGICPVCAMWVGMDLVEHITAQHENILKISFLIWLIEMLLFIQNKYFEFVGLFSPFTKVLLFILLILLLLVLCPSFNYVTNSFTGDYSQLKSRRHKLESYPTLSFSRKDQQDGHWQSFSAGSSPMMSTSKTACDPLLSFLCSAAGADERENVQPDSSSEVRIEEIHSDDIVLERDVQPSLSDKDQIEKSRQSAFVQGLLVSTILDSDF